MMTLVLIVAALTLVFTVMSISASMHYGRLTHDVSWDDVSYFNQGYTLYTAFRNGGVPEFLASYADKPPRSPFAGIAAAAGFLLFGVRDWAPYAINALVVAIFLGFSVYLVRRESAVLIAGVSFFILSTPMAMIAIVDFKPDLLNALLIVVGSLVLLEPGNIQGETPRFCVAGACFGAAILAKATTFPFTMLMAGLAFLCAVATRFLTRADQRSVRDFLRLALAFAIPFVLVCGPHMAVALSNLIEYIRVNTFGEHASLWIIAGGFFTHAAYYFTGPGSIALANHKWFAVASILAALPIIFWKGDKPARYAAFALLGLGTFSYSFVAANPMKNAHLGFTAQVFLFLGSIFLLVLAARSFDLRGRRRFEMAAGVVLALSALLLNPAHAVSAQFWLWDKDGAAQRRLNSDIMTSLFRDTPPEAGLRSVYVATTGMINHDALQWLANKAGRDLQFTGIDPNFGASEALAEAVKFDYAITAESGALGQYEWFPSTTAGSAIDAAIARSAEFSQFASATAPNGKQFFVYRCHANAGKRPFFGWNRSRDLQAFENPNFLYGSSAEPRVWFDAGSNPSPTRIEGVITSRVPRPQRVTVMLNGTGIGRVILNKQAPRRDFRFELNPQPGINEVAFRCSAEDPRPSKDGARWSIVFTKLQIAPASAPYR